MSDSNHGSVTLQAQGKLLITGEYFVLDGALALAVPSHFGQSLEISENTAAPDELLWQSKDYLGQNWFTASWQITAQGIQRKQTNDIATADRLESIFLVALKLKPELWHSLSGKQMSTHLEFPREWGLGTSSTLISLLSQYWDVDPYFLLAKTFGGSGYDIACATANGPLLYQKTNDSVSTKEVTWDPDFKDQIYFAYQGQKQNSREGIQHYRNKATQSLLPIQEVNDLTMAMLKAKTFDEAEGIMKDHEKLVAASIQLPRIQVARFNDFPGQIKSLGAWGGDFVMVLSPWSKEKTTTYLQAKSCPTVLSFEEMVKQ